MTTHLVLPHREHQCVDGDKRIRPGIEWLAAERLDLGVEVLGHDRYLRLRQRGGAQRVDEPLRPPGGDAEQVASDNRGGLCLSALLRRRSNQMLGEVRTGSQLEDRYVEGVEAVVPVAVPAVAALVGALLESAPPCVGLIRVWVNRQ